MQSSCSDVCEEIQHRLHQLGFRLSEEPDHADLLAALAQVKLVRSDAAPAESKTSDPVEWAVELGLAFLEGGVQVWDTERYIVTADANPSEAYLLEHAWVQFSDANAREAFPESISHYWLHHHELADPFTAAERVRTGAACPDQGGAR